MFDCIRRQWKGGRVATSRLDAQAPVPQGMPGMHSSAAQPSPPLHLVNTPQPTALTKVPAKVPLRVLACGRRRQLNFLQPSPTCRWTHTAPQLRSSAAFSNARPL